MKFLPLIEAKRDGRALTAAQMSEIVTGAVRGDLPDYQLAAFLMAVYFRGLNAEETRALMIAMRDSGDVLQFPADARPLVDKHSTGGIGDKVSLVLAPLLACLGFRVPMISGRGLGITGGTLDKLEAIPGFVTALSAERIVDLVQRVGCAMAGQTAYMVPADMQLYALRDATATVPSIPLITASILSKKLAEGIQALVMDVKFGSAAFMPTLESASELARSIVRLAGECGVRTHALLTDMNTPLGRSAGNWLEVKEAVRCLEGYGPEDLQELVIECAACLLVQTGLSSHLTSARQQALVCLSTDAPRRKWDEMLAAQGANPDEFNRELLNESTAPVVVEYTTREEGFITRCDARIIGEIVRDLGGGRMTREDVIDPSVGIDQLAKPGEPFGVGSVLARVHARNQAEADAACARLAEAISFQRDPFEPSRLIRQRIES